MAPFRLAFLLFDYIPNGGLQRDCVAIAEALAARGHEITLYCASWSGPPPPAPLQRAILGSAGRTNHGRNADFHARVTARLKDDQPDLVVGFDRMPGLDVYYQADVSFMAKAEGRGLLYRLTPRYRVRAAFERAVYDAETGAEILLLAEREKTVIQRLHGTPSSRLHLLPPNLHPDRQPPADSAEQRARLRAQLDMGNGEPLILFVAAQPQVKGLDRMIRALGSLPEAQRASLRAIAAAPDDRGDFSRLADRLGVGQILTILGPRIDIVNLMLAADLLVHPARVENAGAVLVEALALRLPVLTTAACGFAPLVEQAGAGQVLPEPFSQAALNQALKGALLPGQIESWRAAADANLPQLNLSDQFRTATDLIERFAQGKRRETKSARPYPEMAEN